MSDKIFQIPSEITKIQTMSHNFLRLQVDTQEGVSPEAISKLMNLFEKLGYFTFSVQEIKAEDLLDLPEIKVEKDEKTPSQRLRSRLFVYWKEKNPKANEDNFRNWYEKVLDNLGQSYLDKLN
jgi:conjugal transfer/entry exclusion protein